LETKCFYIEFVTLQLNHSIYSGQKIIEALENSVSQYPKFEGRFLQVDEIKYPYLEFSFVQIYLFGPFQEGMFISI